VRLYLWDNQPVSEATINDLIAQSDRMFSKEKIGVFGVRMRGREDLLGFCGFVRLEGMEESELWYELTQKVWGRGLATEAAWACVRYAFEEAGMERVIAGADEPNTASLRVIEKLGMKYLGNINPSAPEEPYFALYKEDLFAVMTTG
jgi:ribosomal-protein-alanine N-acetyltransferase